MNAEIIAIGSELLLGQITNTNAQFLSQRLADVGVNVFYHSVVGDNRERLKDVVKKAEKRSDLVIFTGGLGPTKDDLTKETIAECMNRVLVYDDVALNNIKDYFIKRNRVMSENNHKQALVIEGSKVLCNNHGMAPGMALKNNGKIFILLPGPPSEMKPMFDDYGLPYVASQLTTSTQIFSRVLNFFDIGESQLETEIVDLIDTQSNPTIAPLAKDGEVTLRLTVKHESFSHGTKLLDEVEAKILARIGQHFYGYDNTSLLEEATALLKERNLTIAAAESLTGGQFSSELTSVSGASTFFNGSVVCYSNEVKQAMLQVPKHVINTEGAVSSQCAKQLAENVAKLLGSTVGISFTGVAGPDELEGKQPGTVYIGLAVQNMDTTVYELKLAGTRQQIQNRTVKHGLYCLLKQFNKGGNKR